MTTPELPPLRRYELCLRGYENTMKRAGDGEYCWDEDREARERILLARIEALEADAKQTRMTTWAIVRAAAGESWLTIPGHVLVSMSNECAIERRVDLDGHHFRAIDAAREAD